MTPKSTVLLGDFNAFILLTNGKQERKAIRIQED
jgi:hypothetical protein